jgi:hypothetical protein
MTYGIKSYPMTLAERMELFIKEISMYAEDGWMLHEAQKILEELNG